MAPTKEAKNKRSPQEWLNVKDEIERLYVEGGRDLQCVRHHLEKLGFAATSRMFKSRIKKWHFNRKTIREVEWKFMLEEYHRRKNLRPPKETTFYISQDKRGRVTKYKTIADIRKYLRRKQVSDEEFLSSPSDRGNFPHIRSITPPLSPATSPVSASPASQIDANNTDAATLASLMDISGANSRSLNSLSLQNPPDVYQQYACSQAVDWPPDLHGISISQYDGYSLSTGGNNGPQVPAHLSGWPWESHTGEPHPTFDWGIGVVWLPYYHYTSVYWPGGDPFCNALGCTTLDLQYYREIAEGLGDSHSQAHILFDPHGQELLGI